MRCCAISASIRASDNRVVEVLNKIDLLDSGARNALLAQAARNDHMQAVSALTGDGLGELFGLLDRHMTADRVTVDLNVRIDDGAALAWLHDRGDMLERQDDEQFAHLRIALDKADLARFESRYDYHRRLFLRRLRNGAGSPPAPHAFRENT